MKEIAGAYSEMKTSEAVSVVLVRLETRLTAIAADYSDLRAQMHELGRQIELRSQPQWQTYISGAILLGGLFFAFISPIQKAQEVAFAEHRQFVADVNAEFNRRNAIFVTAKEHIDLVNRFDRFEQRAIRDDAAIQDSVNRLSDRLTKHSEEDLRMEKK